MITSYSFHGLEGSHVVLSLSADGDAEARGTVHVRDGTANTVLIIGEEPPQATCADIDEDGVAGITSLQLVGRNPQSGEEVLVFFLGARDLDERGEYDVRVRVGDVDEVVTLAFLLLPAGPPGGDAR